MNSAEIRQGYKMKNKVNTFLLLVNSGYKMRDKTLLFLSVSISSVIYLILKVSLRIIYGKNKSDEMLKRKNIHSLSWISNRPTRIKKDGIILTIYPRRGVYFLGTTLEDTEHKDIQKLDLDRKTIVDVGANIGVYTIPLAKHYPNAKVFAIEASPTIFNELKANCEVNNLVNVILINKAVSNKDNEVIEFYTSPTRSGASTMVGEWRRFITEEYGAKFGVEKVETLTIDTMIRTMGLDEISLLKLDIEGAENLALEGAKNALGHKKIKNMMIEYHTYQNYQYITSLLNKFGYIYQTKEKVSRGDPTAVGNFRGHIIAYLPPTS